MTALATDAIVLHAADYLESSRILRLATREAGVQSVLARGARSSARRFGYAVDLFAQGQVVLEIRPGRDLHSLVSFDVAVSHSGVARDLARFSAASAMSEVALRLLHDESAPESYDRLSTGFERLGNVEGEAIFSVTLGTLWQLLSEVGYRPLLDACVECHAPMVCGTGARLHHTAGGVLCADCARLPGAGRVLPADALDVMRDWLKGEMPAIPPAAVRAHQRLLREFLSHRMSDNRPMRAYQSWERGLA